eukprot:922244-Amphidinium_carterae.1
MVDGGYCSTCLAFINTSSRFTSAMRLMVSELCSSAAMASLSYAFGKTRVPTTPQKGQAFICEGKWGGGLNLRL